MFDSKKNNAESVGANGNNRIVAMTKIKGEIHAQSDFRIDGHVEGSIDTTGRVVVGKTGEIIGKVSCINADVEGKITGTLVVKGILSLKSTAVIEGEVQAEKLSVEPGAVFNVTCSMTGIKTGAGASKES